MENENKIINTLEYADEVTLSKALEGRKEI